MIWTIDTSVTGPAPAADIKKILEASRDHWIETQAQAAEDAIVHAGTAHAGKPGEPKPDYVAISAKAKAAKDAHLKKSSSLRAHMDLGIKQACEQAECFGGIVSATIVGHDDDDHPACPKRLSVAVDQQSV